MFPLSLSGALALVALAYSLLLACKLLLHSSGDTVANKCLAIVAFSMSAWSWGALSRDLGLYLHAPHLLFVATPLFFLFGPALLAYANRITVGANPLGDRRVWLHAVPVVLFLVTAVPFYRLSEMEKLRIYQTNGVMPVLSWLIGPHILIYTVICLRSIRRYERLAQDNFSDLERGNLRWLKRLCIGMLVLLSLDYLRPVLSLAEQWSAGFEPTVLLRMCLLLYTSFLAFSALGQPPYMYRSIQQLEEQPAEESQEATDPLSPLSEKETENQIEKYARSGLRDDSARYYLEKLHAFMRDQQPYLDCDLTLRNLAGMVKLRPHHLSQILNEQLGKSFNDYINEYRIAHARNLLTDKVHAEKPILEIAFASGYNNKVSFYNAFKRFVGMTPTRYRNEQSVSSSQ